MVPIGNVQAPGDESARRRLRVLVIAAAIRHARIRALLMPLADVRLRLHDSPIDALLAAIRRPFHLVLIDQALADAAAPALAQHLARVAPDTGVLRFDDAAVATPDAPVGSHRWDEAPAIVEAWVAARRGSDQA